MRSTLTAILVLLLFSASYGQAEDVISQIRNRYKVITENASAFEMREAEDGGQSEEGGVVKAYYEGRKLQFITSEYFSETGKQRTEYYFDSGKLVFLLDVSLTYNRPIGYDEKKAKENGDTEWYDDKKTKKVIDRYYFHNDKLIQWINGGKTEQHFDVSWQESKGKALLKEAARLKKMFK